MNRHFRSNRNRLSQSLQPWHSWRRSISSLRLSRAGRCRFLTIGDRAAPVWVLTSSRAHCEREWISIGRQNIMHVRNAFGQITRRRLSSAAAFCGALLVAVPQANAFTCEAIPEIRLDAEQSQLLRTFKGKEDLANTARLTIVLGPALDCITSSNATDCVVSVTASEWDKMASAPGKIAKTTAEAIAI
jgi:hypothetical protein